MSAAGTSGTARRADAQRNIDRILAAGLEVFGRRAGASVAEVAKAAGVGRVTLYGHFPSRADLAKALVTRAIEDTVRQLDELDLDAFAADEALRRLVKSQWQYLARNRNLRENLAGDVDARWLRRQHDPVMDPVDRLLARGQDEGSVRTDMPRAWMTTCLYSLVHAAADAIADGSLTESEAIESLTESLMAIFRPAGSR